MEKEPPTEEVKQEIDETEDDTSPTDEISTKETSCEEPSLVATDVAEPEEDSQSAAEAEGLANGDVGENLSLSDVATKAAEDTQVKAQEQHNEEPLKEESIVSSSEQTNHVSEMDTGTGALQTKIEDPPTDQKETEITSAELFEAPDAPDLLITPQPMTETATDETAASTACPSVLPPPELPSIEVCLFGYAFSENNDEASEPANNRDETEHPRLVDDDWDFVRPPMLWKSSPPHKVNAGILRKIAQNGFPDEGSHRALAWRVLLGYLPPDNKEWETSLKQNRELYRKFVGELFQNATDCRNGEDLRWKQRQPCKQNDDEEDGSKEAVNTDRGADDRARTLEEYRTLWANVAKHLNQKGLDGQVLEGAMKSMNALQVKGLEALQSAMDSQGDESKEQVTEEELQHHQKEVDNFIESARHLDEIRKDVDRTFPDLKFFLDPVKDLGNRRYAALERILYVWSRYNKGVKYVQGMNEIVGTIYYVLANDWNEEWACEAEADTYWLFNILLADMRDVFVPDLDDAATGIQGRINMLETLLKSHDPEVTAHLSDEGVECSFFAVRWLTTLLSREFLLPDTIRLWDSMFSSTHKDNFLSYVCVTMVVMIREQLLKADFSTCLRILQSYPSVPMDSLLLSTRALWLYERQIAVACRKGQLKLHQALQAIPPPRGIIMAFGFRHGVLPPPPVDMFEKAQETAAATVRGAKNAVVGSAQGLLGRATKLYNSGMQALSPSKMEKPKVPSQEEKDTLDLLTHISEDDMDDMYLSAIQDAEAGKLLVR